MIDLFAAILEQDLSFNFSTQTIKNKKGNRKYFQKNGVPYPGSSIRSKLLLKKYYSAFLFGHFR